jgi:hypothetical protein
MLGIRREHLQEHLDLFRRDGGTDGVGAASATTGLRLLFMRIVRVFLELWGFVVVGVGRRVGVLQRIDRGVLREVLTSESKERHVRKGLLGDGRGDRLADLKQKIGRRDPDGDVRELRPNRVQKLVEPFPAITIGDDEGRSVPFGQSPTAARRTSSLAGEELCERHDRTPDNDRVDSAPLQRREEAG